MNSEGNQAESGLKWWRVSPEDAANRVYLLRAGSFSDVSVHAARDGELLAWAPCREDAVKGLEAAGYRYNDRTGDWHRAPSLGGSR